MRRIGWVLAALAASVLAALAIGMVAERNARARFEAALTADVRLRQSLLTSEIARFRLLPEALSDDRDVVGTLAGTPGMAAALNRKLEGLAASTGAAVIYVIDRDGNTLAASNWRMPDSFVGNN